MSLDKAPQNLKGSTITLSETCSRLVIKKSKLNYIHSDYIYIYIYLTTSTSDKTNDKQVLRCTNSSEYNSIKVFFISSVITISQLYL